MEENKKIVQSVQTVRSAHERSISEICWYPFDDGLFTSSSADHLVKVWDAETMQVLFLNDM